MTHWPLIQASVRVSASATLSIYSSTVDAYCEVCIVSAFICLICCPRVCVFNGGCLCDCVLVVQAAIS